MTILQPAVLDVHAPIGSGQYHYALSRPGEAFVEATQRVWMVDVNVQDIQMACGKIDDAVLAANTGCDDDDAIATLRAYGRALYQALLPRHEHSPTPLRQALRELTGPLVICAHQSGLHWELLYDEEKGEFLGLSHEIARRLKTTDAPGTRGVESKVLRCLLIGDPSAEDPASALPDAAGEAGQLCAWFERRDVRCDLLQGADATYERTVDLLTREQYHVIHYAGHIVRHPDNGMFALRLADGELTTDWIRTRLGGSPLVFLNGCSSAAGGVGTFEGVEAMTDAMLAGGARIVVGSIYPVPDIGARTFAERFYDQLLHGAPYGAAMRHAREELSRDPECRASWAGFVMYGNPCLTLVVAEPPAADGVPDLLADLGIRADELDEGAANVLRRSAEHASDRGVLATAHLFAALVAGSDPTLRDRLAARGLEPDELRRAFQSQFAGDADEDAPGYVRLSENATTIIKAAAAAARTASRPLMEGDLQRAFVACAGGATQRILLEQLDLDVALLLDDEEALGPETRTALEIAGAIAIHAGDGLVGSPQLLQALLCVEPSPVTAALRRVGLPETKLDGLRPPTARRRAVPADAGDVRHSKTVREIIEIARAAAAVAGRADIEDEDLFQAFVGHGGGTVGDLLLAHGLPLALLTSPLFGEDGSLRMERFDPQARSTLERAADCARRKHHRTLTRSHVLYGLLLAGGSLADGIRAQQRDPDELADRLLVELPTAARHVHQDVLRLGRMTVGLRAALCEADHAREEDRQELVGEPYLACGLLGDGGGSAGAFLLKHNIRRSGLLP